MNKTQETLRIASRAFRIMALGGKFSAEDVKLFGDMCALALPMKYRFNKEDLAEQEAFAQNHSAPSPAPGTPEPPQLMFIGDLRRSLFMSYECEWNGYIRDLTARLEQAGGMVPVDEVRTQIYKHSALLMTQIAMMKEAAQNGQGWVRVEDRLPEADERVIVCTSKGERWAARCKQFDNTSKYEKVLLPEGMHPVNAVITHWQPLPAPPTGDAPTEKK